MDTFMFLMAMIIVMLGLQYGQSWIVFGVLALLVISTRSIGTILLTVGAVIILYMIRNSANFNQYLPIVLIGFIVVALLISALQSRTESSGEEYYLPNLGGY